MKRSFIAPTIAIFVLSVIMALSVPAKAYTYTRTMEIGDITTVTTSDAPTSRIPTDPVFRTYSWSSSNSSVAGVFSVGSQCTIFAWSGGTATISNRQMMSYHYYNSSLQMTLSQAEYGSGDTWIIRVLYPELALKEVSPQNGAVEQDSDTDIVFTYNTAINEGTAYSAITLTDSETRETVDIEKSITGSSLTLKPSVKLQTGHSYTATVPASALQNPDGKALAAASTTSFRVNVAEITEISPADGAVNVAVNTPIVIKYDSNIQKGSAWNSISIKNKETGENVSYTSDLNGNTITLTPQSNYSYNTLHELTIPAGAVANSQGAETAKARTFTFTTKPGNLSAVSSSPQDGAKDVSVDAELQVTFNYPIAAGDKIDSIILKDNTSGLKAVGKTAIAGSTLTFIPNEKLNYQSTHTLIIPPNALINNAGEPNSYEITVGFTTMSQESETVDAPVIEQDDLEITIIAENGSSIYYTTDNTNPVTNGTRYTEPFTIGKNDAMIRAVAVKNGTVSGESVYKVFTLTETALYNFGGISNDDYKSVVPAADGFIAVGNSGNGSFGNGDWNGAAGKGGTDAIAVKYDKSGNVVWKQSFGGSGGDYYTSVAAVGDGFVAVGYSYDESFANGDLSDISGKGMADAIAVKYDKNGNIEWKKNFGGSVNDYFYSVAAVEDGFIAVGESYKGSFGNGDLSDLSGKGDSDAIAVKYDKNGSIVWITSFGGSGGDIYYSVAVSGDGFIAAGGSDGDSFGSGDWSGVAGNGYADAIAVKYDKNGNVVWKQSFGGAGGDSYNLVIALEDGFVAAGRSAGGSFRNGDWSDVYGKGNTDAIAVKYDKNGNIVWKQSFGGNGDDYYNSVIAAEDCFIAVGYSGNGSFGNGDWKDIAGRGGEDAIAVKYNKNGNIIWQKNFGGSGNDKYNSAVASEDGFIAVGNSAANSFGNGDWENVTGRGSSDACIVTYGEPDNTEPAITPESGGASVAAKEQLVRGEEFTAGVYLTPSKNASAVSVSVQYPSCLTYIGTESGYNSVYVSQSGNGDVKTLNLSCDFMVDNPTLAAEPCLFAKLEFKVNEDSDYDEYSIAFNEEQTFILDTEYNQIKFTELGNKTFSVAPADLKELFILGNTKIGAPVQYRAAFFPNTAEDKAVVWSVSDESVATIDEDGTLTPQKNGSVTVTVKNKEGDIEKSLDIEIFGTKTYIGTMTSNIGAFAEDYSKTDTERILYVPKDTLSVALTASFDGGSLISDYGVFFNGIAKEIAIDELPKTITLTKREADHNDVVYTITIKKEREKEQTPDIKIDFENEMLTGFLQDGEYTINGNTVTTSWGAISAEDYIGTDTTVLQIIKKAANEDNLDSEEQRLEIPPYPDAPKGIGAVKASDEGAYDGAITDVNATMEYRDESVGEWLPITGTEVIGLSKGNYEVRYKATETSFASAAVTVNIGVVGKCKITFVNYDNEILQIVNAPIGSTPQYTGAKPEKPSDVMYSYSFSGWEPEITVVKENMTYTAQFDAIPREYRVTLNINGGEVIGNVTKYTYGTALTLPTPRRENYKFSGWYERADCTGTAVTEISAEATGDKTYYAKWTADVYSISYRADGGLIENEEDYSAYSYGTGLILPIPIKENYHFVGWYDNEEFDGAAVTAIPSTDKGDKTYYAKWTEVEPSEYLITFVNYDNTLLQSEMTAVGEKAKYSGETPVKPNDDKYSYTFAGWSPEITETTGIAIYTAQFERTPIVYRVELTAEGKAAVLVPEAGTYALIFAAYDNSVLTGVELQSITLDKACEREFEPQTLDTGSADKIKVMLWEDINGIKPLCGSDERGL